MRLERWLLSFPSFGYLLAVPAENVPAVLRLFDGRDIAAADIGAIAAGSTVAISDGRSVETIWDFSQRPLLGCGVGQRVAA